MDKPLQLGIDHAKPGSDSTVFHTEPATPWDAPYKAFSDLLDILEQRMDHVLGEAEMTTQHRCTAILQKNDAFCTLRIRLANLIRVDPLNPSSPFYQGKHSPRPMPGAGKAHSHDHY